MAPLEIKKTHWEPILLEASEGHGLSCPSRGEEVDDGQTRSVGLRKRNSVDLVQRIGNYARYAVDRWLMVTQVHKILQPRLVFYSPPLLLLSLSPITFGLLVYHLLLRNSTFLAYWLRDHLAERDVRTPIQMKCKKQRRNEDGLPEGTGA